MITKLVINSIEKLNEHKDVFKDILDKHKTRGVFSVIENHLVDADFFLNSVKNII